MKRYLYNYVKSLVLGEPFEQEGGEVLTPAISVSGIEHYGFWNNQIKNMGTDSGFPMPAVLFDINSIANKMYYHRDNWDNITNQPSYHTIQFSLHLVWAKTDADNDENYLSCLDKAEEIEEILRNKTCLGIRNVRLVEEIMDDESSVMMDYQLLFTCVVTNVGSNKLIKVTRPIEMNVTF